MSEHCFYEDCDGVAETVLGDCGHDWSYAPGSGDDNDEHPMVTAYHTLFDYKDKQEPGSEEAYLAFQTLSQMSDMMDLMGVPVPVRHDAPRPNPAEAWVDEDGVDYAKLARKRRNEADEHGNPYR